MYLSTGEDNLVEIFSYTDTEDPIGVRYVTFRHRQKFSATNVAPVKLRNMRNPDLAAATCLNNVGSFNCLPLDGDKLAIGWGGHTTSGSARPAEFPVILPDGTHCMDHKIPNYSGRYAPQIGVVGRWLWLCGGETTTDCRKLDLNAASPAWINAPNLAWAPRHGAMYTYDGYMYVLGGWTSGGCRKNHVRISESGTSWETRSNFHVNIHRHQAVVDEVNGKVYVLGGHDCSNSRAESRVYIPSSNSWTAITNVPWAYYDYSAAIIKQKNGERWLMIQRRDYHQIRYWNIDQNNGWHHVSDNFFNPRNGHMRMVSMNEYTVYMFGADTSHYGTNLANFWQYNPENYKFEDLKNKFVPVEHVWGYWTNAKTTMRAFTNCVAERTYAAVGWGGSDWSTDWSVMLRKTWQSNSKERKPATCHGAIPSLSPGRYYHGIASIDYQIWVCGGMFSKYLFFIKLAGYIFM